MRKLVVLLFFSVQLFACSAFAIDMPEGNKPTFFEPSTAYSSQYFDQIMQAYGLTFGEGGQVPSSYAKIADGKAVFNPNSIAYDPKGYDAILTAYGLELTPANAREILKVSSYAKVEGDKVVFGSTSIAYGGPEWTNILKAYTLSQQPVATPEPPMAQAIGDDDGDGVPNDRDACPDTPKYAAVDERGCWALAAAVLFDFDKATIKQEFRHLLDQTKKVFDSAPMMRVQVEGHADSTGPEKYNQGLSERRARAVVKYLIEKVGIAADRLTAVGYGELKPAYSNDTKEGRAKNRRVEFTPAQ